MWSKAILNKKKELKSIHNDLDTDIQNNVEIAGGNNNSEEPAPEN